MYLSELKLWNFRKYGSGNDDLILDLPDLNVQFKPGLNVLIGENDSGKTAIIDAIKLVLKTHSSEWIKLEFEDFHGTTKRLRIECILKGLEDKEASHFTEWLGWEGTGVNAKPFLKLILDANRTKSKILSYEIKAGVDNNGYLLTAEAKDYLRATYLRPLRDAHSDLVPKKNSRLSQIFSTHEAFKERTNDHILVEKIQELNSHIQNYFDGKDNIGNPLPATELKGKELKDEIDKYLTSFINKTTRFEVSGGNLKNILESLKLLFAVELNLGLGSHNLLYISSELLHLNKSDWSGLRLGLIEEIEAHLHPQVQLQVIERLQEIKEIQLIFTTHSPNLGAKVKLENLIICHNNKTYPLAPMYTLLEAPDYKFLERFLDVTKANLFFAKGLILVEGWAEELLLPAIANKLGINLTEKGVSIVNVGSTAFLRYSKIFQRKGNERLTIPVAIISDVDIQPIEAGPMKPDPLDKRKKGTTALTKTEIDTLLKAEIKAKSERYDGQSVKAHISHLWTLEYCIAISTKLRKLFFEAVLKAQKLEAIDAGVQNLNNYDTRITEIDNEFNSWTDSDEQIAFKIYNQEILNQKTSKSIIAQEFAGILEASNIAKEDLLQEPSIQYILNAIKYAANNN